MSKEQMGIPIQPVSPVDSLEFWYGQPTVRYEELIVEKSSPFVFLLKKYIEAWHSVFTSPIYLR